MMQALLKADTADPGNSWHMESILSALSLWPNVVSCWIRRTKQLEKFFFFFLTDLASNLFVKIAYGTVYRFDHLQIVHRGVIAVQFSSPF